MVITLFFPYRHEKGVPQHSRIHLNPKVNPKGNHRDRFL